jgi:hypothetical protein
MIPLILAAGAVAYVLEKLQDQRTAAEKQVEAEILQVTTAVAVTTAAVGLLLFAAIPLNYSAIGTVINLVSIAFDLLVGFPLLLIWVMFA